MACRASAFHAIVSGRHPMRIVRQSPTELVVRDNTEWLAWLFAAAAVASAYATLIHHKYVGFAAVGLALLFAAILVRRTEFVFDGLARQVHWTGRNLFKVKAGTISFDAIEEIVTEAQMGDKGVASYRLTLQTTDGPVPMAYVYTNSRDGYAQLRRTILMFIRPGAEHQAAIQDADASLQASVVALLRQGRKLDAVALVRSMRNCGLTEAKKQVDSLAEGQKSAP